VKPRSIPQVFDLPRGTVLGKYEILRKLAVGGMAEIYLARQRGTAGFEKLVVIKRILPNVAEDPTFVQMFLGEARLAATLQHPNIADVYDVDEFEGAPFFAMEYVHGQDVRHIRQAARQRDEHVPLAIGLAIVHGTASALDYAHERTAPDGLPLGLVHRDVSASNVIVSYDGAVKLLDFGIARASSHTHKTQTGTLKGKIPYMSPEQCRGMPLDFKSDLFSLGVVMYELTTGRRPFRGESDFEIMDQIVHKGAPPPSSVVTGYPPELEAIVLKLLAMQPADRYGSAEAMLHDLDPFIGAHRLWVSPKALGKYMKALFDDKIAAWELAEREGVTLGQHITEAITSPTAKSELLTPPSAFPGLVPISQEMPAVKSAQIAAVEPPGEVASSSGDVSSRSMAYPELRPSRTGLWIVLALLAIGAGGAAGFFYYNGQKADAPAVRGEPVTEPVRMEPVKTGPGTTEPGKGGAEPGKSADDPATSAKAGAEPGKSAEDSATSGAASANTGTEPGKSAADPAKSGTASATSGAASATSGAASAKKASATSGPASTKAGAEPAKAGADPGKVVDVSKPPVAAPKKPAVKPAVKPPVKPKKPKDTWDPNSPFLPPS